MCDSFLDFSLFFVHFAITILFIYENSFRFSPKQHLFSLFFQLSNMFSSHPENELSLLKKYVYNGYCIIDFKQQQPT